jgi:hypothetical protein
MKAKIAYDESAPSASVEFMIIQPLPDYDMEEVEATVPRDVDPLLASQGFHDLLDESRSLLERELGTGGLTIAQLTGAICHDDSVYRPGVWLVVQEAAAGPGQPMSAAGRAQLNQAVDALSAIFE